MFRRRSPPPDSGESGGRVFREAFPRLYESSGSFSPQYQRYLSRTHLAPQLTVPEPHLQHARFKSQRSTESSESDVGQRRSRWELGLISKLYRDACAMS